MAEEIGHEFIVEVKRRVIAMVAFVDPIAEGPPVREGDWLQFIYYLCLHWGIPGFSEKKVGRPREWTDQRSDGSCL